MLYYVLTVAQKGDENMLISEEQLRANFAKKLCMYRKHAGMTQLELAEKLNYSDKSVSKWERSEGIPDLYVIMRIADLFGVTVNDLIDEGEFKKPLLSRNKVLTTFLAMGIPWLLAVILLFLFQLILPAFPAWTFFVYALPLTAIVAIVFTFLWWNRILQFISVSALIWTIPTCLVVAISIPRFPMIYIIAAVLQVMNILWFLMKK